MGMYGNMLSYFYLMGMYGNMLSYFPEQLVSFNYFTMNALLSDGYETRKILKYNLNGVFHNSTSTVKDSNGNLVKFVSYNLLSAEALEQGNFVVRNDGYDNGAYFRIIRSSDWPDQGGFYFYEIEKLVGTMGTKSINSGFSDGSQYFV